MRKMRIAIYDREELYAQRLVKFMMFREDWDFAAAFTEKSLLLEHCRKEKPDLLLVEEGLWEEELLQLADKVILLSEKEEAEEGEEKEAARICRYQAADELLKEIHYLCGEQGRGQKAGRGEAELYCVYSPSGHPRQSLFAWNLARVLGGEEVLYVNLQENSGFEELFGRAYQRNLSDLLYLKQNRKANFAELVKSVVCEEDGLQYLPPMQNSEDVFLLGAKEWEDFFDQLRGECGYRALVLDTGVIFPGFWQLLQKASCLYEPLLPFEYAKIRQREFDRLLEWKYPQLNRRVRKVQLPAEREELREHSSFSRLEMQDFVRRLLEKEVGELGTVSAEAENPGGDPGRSRVIS